MIEDFEHYAVTCFREFGDKITSEPQVFDWWVEMGRALFVVVSTQVLGPPEPSMDCAGAILSNIPTALCINTTKLLLIQFPTRDFIIPVLVV